MVEDDGGVHGADVWVQSIENLEAGSPVPLMTMQLQAIFQSAFTRPFRIGDYMGDMPFGRRDIIGPEHPTTIPQRCRAEGDRPQRYRRNLWMSPWHENAAYLPP